eukprot:3163216-Pleurochrysis_carterae.AAC.1
MLGCALHARLRLACSVAPCKCLAAWLHSSASAVRSGTRAETHTRETRFERDAHAFKMKRQASAAYDVPELIIFRSRSCLPRAAENDPMNGVATVACNSWGPSLSVRSVSVQSARADRERSRRDGRRGPSLK